MASINVLVSTMYRTDTDFIEQMNLQTPAIVVNQLPGKIVTEEIAQKDSVTMINSSDRGLSKSRNLLIENSNSDISIITDDDVRFLNNYEKVISYTYEQNTEADVIVFQVPRVGKNSDTRAKSYATKKKKLNYLTSMKVSSVEITFKTASIKDNNIRFNPNIGAGTEFQMGEENQFLFECLNKGLTILYIPIPIAVVNVSDSIWFKGYDEAYFESTGAKFYNMSKNLYPLFILQFGLRKKSLYEDNFSLMQVLKMMYSGVKKYKTKVERSS